MARAFQPEVVLLNLDNDQESYRVAGLVARELPEARLVAYSRRKDTESVEQSTLVGFDGRPVKIVPAEERGLVAAIKSALTGPEEQTPIAADGGHEDVDPPQRVDSASPLASRGGPVAPSPSVKSAEPFLRRFADTASEWLLTRSPRAEEELLATLAEDVQAPSFGGRGRDVVRRGLEGLAWRLGGDFRLVPSDLDGEPALAVVVETRDGHWHRAGHFVVQSASGSRVSYFDYRDDEPSGDGERESS